MAVLKDKYSLLAGETVGNVAQLALQRYIAHEAQALLHRNGPHVLGRDGCKIPLCVNRVEVQQSQHFSLHKRQFDVHVTLSLDEAWLEDFTRNGLR